MSDTTPAPAQVTPDTPAALTDTGAPKQDATPAIEPGHTGEQNPAPETVPDTEDDKKVSQWELNRKARNQERWRAMKASQEEAARLRAELARYKAPQNLDYSRIEDPDEALALRTAAKVRESMAGDIEVRAQSAAQEADRVMAENVAAMLEDARERMPDFDQVVTHQTPIHANAVPFIAESERGAEIVYHLGKNPQVARDLWQKFQSNPAQALIELGRIEARIAAPPVRTASKAPRPAPAISGGSSPPSFDPSQASVADMAAEMRKLGLIR